MLPAITVDLAKLRHNALAISALCKPHGVSVAAVTKCFCGDNVLARTLLDTGITLLADSRLENLARTPAHSGHQRLLLRAPLPSEAPRVVAGCDISANSELATLRALEAAAKASNTTHGILLMVDVGDLREGLYYDNTAAIDAACDYVAGCSHLHLRGMGLNLTCYGSVIPSHENMARFAEITTRQQARLRIRFELVSGGNSSAVPMLKAGALPAAINNLRFGEAILCGTEAAYKKPIEGFATDIFTLHAGLIEVQTKPSMPLGPRGVNAFGEKDQYTDIGRRRRALLAVGRQDTHHLDLTPLDAGVRIIGACSDHLLVDIEEAAPLAVGDTLRFAMGYTAILRGFASASVHHSYLNQST